METPKDYENLTRRTQGLFDLFDHTLGQLV